MIILPPKYTKIYVQQIKMISQYFFIDRKFKQWKFTKAGPHEKSLFLNPECKKNESQ